MDAWDRMHSWDLVLPPSRPSQQHLAWFRRQLGHLRPHDPVAILGSTPELRDLLALHGFCNVWVLERNALFFEQMNRLRVTPSKETFVHGDWMQTLPDCAGRFSAVFSDLTSGNVPYSQQKDFYSLITQSLRPGGIFCDKLLTHPIPHESLDALLAKYEAEPLNWDTVNRFNCEVFFCSDLLSRFGTVDTDKFYVHLRQRDLGPTVRAILERLPLITPPGMTWSYGPPWTVVRKVFDTRLLCSGQQLEARPSPYAKRLRLLRWTRVRDAQ